MPFRCPNCQMPDALTITAGLALPADSRSDEIMLQTITCQRCDLAGVAVYEESRRGSLETDAFDHSGYELDPATVAEVKALLDLCPAPGNAGCDCPAHRCFAGQDDAGRWNGLRGLRLGKVFTIRR